MRFARLKILGPDSTKTSPAEFTKLYQTCVTALETKRGKPRDQQLRDLLGACYTMHQQPNESVADFAHRFTETQHELEKLLPKIHRAADADGNDEVELIYSFSIKLKKSISKDLMFRDFKFKGLQEIISAAQSYELHSDSLPGKDFEDYQPENSLNMLNQLQSILDPYNLGLVLVTSHNNRTLVIVIRHVMYLLQVGLGLINIIQMGLIFKIVLILLQVFLLVIQVNPLLDLKVHQKYVTCLINLRGPPVSFLTTNVFITVYINVRPVINGAASPVIIGLLAKLILLIQGQTHVASTTAASSGQSASCENGPGFRQSEQASPSPDLTTVLSSVHNSLQSLSVRMEKLERPPVPTPSVAPPPLSCPKPRVCPGPDSLLQAPAYSYPAITAIPNHLSIPALDLANKHILWTPITSAGVSLPLPIDSCCSLSLVSKAHADAIALKHPHLTFTKLPSSLPVAVANPSSQLNAIGLMQVPIIWGNGRPSIFSLLVVPGLAWYNPVRPKSFEVNQGPHRPFRLESSFC